MPTAPRWAAEVLERHEPGSCSAWTTASAIATVHTRMPRGAMAKGTCRRSGADLRYAAATGGKHVTQWVGISVTASGRYIRHKVA